MEDAGTHVQELSNLGEPYLDMLTTRIVVLEDGQGALGEGELWPAVGTELLVEDEQGGPQQGDSATPTISTQTEVAGGVVRLALDLGIKDSADNGRVVGAEVR